MSKFKRGEKDIFTKELQDQFLECYINNGFNITKACIEVGISRQTFYNAITWKEEFAKLIEMSKKVFKTILQSSIMEGVMCTDLVLRQTYLKLLPASVFTEILGFEPNPTDVTFKIDKDKIQLV